ncbi:hypothetical protein OAP63_06615 [Vibrio sp.]|uniref:Uncharacterized protein n=1 Tax=Vibrio viridaestus TaxID=2487322 RepID=A0A3N9TJF4_9VIBR|nr:hypothetical protein [Vibrio viridaestus]MDC0610389.1 hypothetical protein [Vibrio sp.]RQW64291.1 hypothetical protein EES38_06830 [Vibrio viridaestus]
MENLSCYVLSLQHPVSDLKLINLETENTRYFDDGVWIESSSELATFSNGVVLRKQQEIDHEDNPEVVCDECWICYEVISAPDQLNITPKKKVFTNRCQESFWLKMTQQQLSE